MRGQTTDPVLAIAREGETISFSKLRSGRCRVKNSFNAVQHVDPMLLSAIAYGSSAHKDIAHPNWDRFRVRYGREDLIRY